MRLIDADELEKKWTIASPEPYNTDAVEVLDSIREATTVDAVQVVRCKECEYAYRIGVPKYQYGCMKMSAFARGFRPDYFCAYGERRR